MDMLPSCPYHRAERAAVAIAADRADAWGTIADDVAPAADRHIAGARVGRMMCTQFRSWFGHPMPATVVPCTVSIVSRNGSPQVLHEAADHLLLVTDRA